PSLNSVVIPEASDDALVAYSMDEGWIAAGTVGHYSRQALLIGRRAEEIALLWAKQAFPDAERIRWVSAEGETPGWDIEVLHRDGQLTALEVKGASGRMLLNFELTAGELEASRRLGPRYLLILVANCLGVLPRIQVVANPSELFASRTLHLQPIRYRVF